MTNEIIYTYQRDDEMLSELLSLVGMEVPVKDIIAWKESDCEAVENWVVIVHCATSSYEHFFAGKKPEILDSYKTKKVSK
jgi:hypothetical protein